MKISEDFIPRAKIAEFDLVLTLNSHNVRVEIYHENVPREKQIVTATKNTKSNTLRVTINLDKLEQALKKEK